MSIVCSDTCRSKYQSYAVTWVTAKPSEEDVFREQTHQPLKAPSTDHFSCRKKNGASYDATPSPYYQGTCQQSQDRGTNGSKRERLDYSIALPLRRGHALREGLRHSKLMTHFSCRKKKGGTRQRVERRHTRTARRLYPGTTESLNEA